ncbi:NGG1p interacting factor 3 [Suillus subalutaceus]|uniref:NGG1p interacting factor 3 n=1 Tax=Suillus subalutaceus TaxID=48586 RepID=UPI001B8872C9|nr:NGG1p interacting factor 3 [Suillus subalutaceus]KAG1846194.1 NGG1p interacting factor 3 [Suillus subalutaceus]
MSIVVKSVCKALERIAPLRLAEPWDKVGLIIESPVPRSDAKRVVLTIDLTTAVLEETLKVPTALVITYHPPLFKPITSLTLADPLQASLLKLSAAGTSVFCPHSSLDATWGGINDWLAEGVMGAQEAIGKVDILGEVKGEAGGAGRIVTLDEPIPIEELVQRVKKHLSLSQVDVGRPFAQKSIKSVAICAGAGGTLLSGVDADVYFTGEMQHHEVLAAVARGRYVILCGHTNTERGYLPVLAKKLSDALSEVVRDESSSGLSREERIEIEKYQIDIHISEVDRHPLDRM